MATNAEYLRILRARTYAVTSKRRQVVGYLLSYALQRRSPPPRGPSNRTSATLQGWDRNSAVTVAPYVQRLAQSVDLLSDHTRLANDTVHARGMLDAIRTWGSIPADRPAIRRSDAWAQAATALQEADATLARYRASRMWSYDTLNASWWSRYVAGRRRIIRSITPASVGHSVGTFGRSIVQGATGTPVGSKDTGAGRLFGSSRGVDDEDDAPPPEEAGGWSWVVGGLVISGIVAGGAAIYFGMQDRKAREVQQRKTGKKLVTMRRKLRGAD